MDATQTGLLIKESRIEKQMTQQALADALNVSATAVSKWENGHSLPDITLLEPLSSILDVSITDLVLGTRSNNNMSDNISKEANASDAAVKSVINEATRQKKRFKLKTVLITVCTVSVLLLLWLFLFSIGLPARQKNVVLSTKITEDGENGPFFVIEFASGKGKNLYFSTDYIMGETGGYRECTIHIREVPISFNESNTPCSWGVSTDFLNSPDSDVKIIIDYWGEDVTYSLREEVNKLK